MGDVAVGHCLTVDEAGDCTELLQAPFGESQDIDWNRKTPQGTAKPDVFCAAA